MKYTTLFMTLFLWTSNSMGAPLPQEGSKTLAPELGVHNSRFGFEILAQNTDWIKTPPPQKSRYIETVYRSPEVRNESRGTLTVRVDRMKSDAPLKSYVKRWVKEYPKYGYNVLGSKPFRSRGKAGYIIDLIHNKKQRQLRQVIYLKNKTAVLMTCRDHRKNFKSSVKDCNRIVKGFRWTQS